MAVYLRQKYQDEKIDLVLPLVAPRLKDILAIDPTLFSKSPKVFYDFETERAADLKVAGPHATGVWANLAFSETLDMALKLRPGTRTVFVAAGSSAEDQRQLRQARSAYQPYEAGISFRYLTDMTLGDLQRQLGSVPSDSIVIFLVFTTDPAGNKYAGPEAIAAVAPTSAAPIFGMSDRYLGAGVLGGSLIDFTAVGERLAHVSLQILGGEPVDNIASQTVPSVAMFDWRQLQRWGISETALPEGSIVRFREPTFWEEYREEAFGLVGAIVVEGLLIAWLLFLRRRRQQAEAENIELHSRVSEIVSNVPGVVWESRIDPITKLRKTTFVSDHIQKMLGYSAEEWLKQPPGFGIERMPEEERAQGIAESDAVIRSGQDAVSEYRWVTRDGRVLWIENYLSPIFASDGKVVGLRGVALDVTKRKLAEEKAREAEEMDKALLAAIPDLMFLQTLDGVYLDYHAVNLADLIAPPEQFLGKNIRDILPADLADQFAQCFEQAEEGGAPQILEYTVELGDTEKWFEARMVRSGDKILSIVRDITDLKRKTQEALELTGRLISVQEDERARLARELHDGISQNLALLSIELAMFARRNEFDQESVDAEMKRLSSRVGELSGELRRISQELHPAKLEQLGLVTAIRGFCNEVAQAHDLSIEFEDRNIPSSISDTASLCLYRIAQEALQNIVKHSGAKRVEIKISANGDGLKLGVVDDGRGFDARTISPNGALGLVSMRERVRLLNGKISIVSQPGEGTRIEATVPV